MAVQLSTSRSLTSYFSSETGKVYLDIFDEVIQKFLTVRDLTSFFTTCQSIGKHRSTFAFQSAFIESRYSAEKLKQLAIDCLLKKPGLSFQNRLMNCLSPSERLFLKRGAVPLWPSEDWETIPPRELDTIRQENDLIDEEWNAYHSSPNEDEKDPQIEEQELLGIPVDQAPASEEPIDLEIPEDQPAADLVFPGPHIHHPYEAEARLNFDRLEVEDPRAPSDGYDISRLIKQVGVIILNYYDPTGLIIPAVGLFAIYKFCSESPVEISSSGIAKTCAMYATLAMTNYFSSKISTLCAAAFIAWDWNIRRRN